MARSNLVSWQWLLRETGANPAHKSTVITQCEIRKLYEKKNEPGIRDAIELAKNYERRRCGHHPDQYPKPLSTLECLSSVVDPKQTGQNKHRYVVASQSQEVRRALRGVRAVPLIYIKRSVMILEPMADDSAEVRLREEKAKFRAELKKRTPSAKRKREEGSDEEEEGGGGGAKLGNAEDKKKKKFGVGKAPNPLSVKKSKKNPQQIEEEKRRKQKEEAKAAAEKPKKKRRRRAKGNGDGERDGATAENGTGDAGGDAGDE